MRWLVPLLAGSLPTGAFAQDFGLASDEEVETLETCVESARAGAHDIGG